MADPGRPPPGCPYPLTPPRLLTNTPCGSDPTPSVAGGGTGVLCRTSRSCGRGVRALCLPWAGCSAVFPGRGCLPVLREPWVHYQGWSRNPGLQAFLRHPSCRVDSCGIWGQGLGCLRWLFCGNMSHAHTDLKSALGAGSRDKCYQPGRSEGWRLQSFPARGREALPAEKEARGVCASRGAGSPQAWSPRSPVTWIYPCPSSLPTHSAAATCSFLI